jgi:hypothetical protein
MKVFSIGVENEIVRKMSNSTLPQGDPSDFILSQNSTGAHFIDFRLLTLISCKCQYHCIT